MLNTYRTSCSLINITGDLLVVVKWLLTGGQTGCLSWRPCSCGKFRLLQPSNPSVQPFCVSIELILILLICTVISTVIVNNNIFLFRLIFYRANTVTDESLESTRRMIALCEEVGYLTNFVSFPLVNLNYGSLVSGFYFYFLTHILSCFHFILDIAYLICNLQRVGLW